MTHGFLYFLRLRNMQFSYCRMTYRQFPFQHHLNQKLVKFEKKISRNGSEFLMSTIKQITYGVRRAVRNKKVLKEPNKNEWFMYCIDYHSEYCSSSWFACVCSTTLEVDFDFFSSSFTNLLCHDRNWHSRMEKDDDSDDATGTSK